MYVSENWIINLLVLYLLHSISILICDFLHRSRADVDIIPSYIRHLNFGKIILALFIGPLLIFAEFAVNIGRRSRTVFISSWEVYYAIVSYGFGLYEPKWTYFMAISAVHFIARRIARYTRNNTRFR